MAPKVFRSTLTWRSLDYQDSVLAPVVPNWPNVPIYTGEEDLTSLLRPTKRKSEDDLYMASLAVLAKNEEDFRERFGALVKRFRVMAVEDKTEWRRGGLAAVASWRLARKKDAGSHGGKISADKKKSQSKAAIESIRDRWPLPSKEWPTKALLKEAGVSLNTVKSVLGKRPIAQYNYQAKQKRAANKVKK